MAGLTRLVARLALRARTRDLATDTAEPCSRCGVGGVGLVDGRCPFCYLWRGPGPEPEDGPDPTEARVSLFGSLRDMERIAVWVVIATFLGTSLWVVFG